MAAKILPLTVISGAEGHLRRQFLSGYIAHLEGLGYRISRVDASVRNAIRASLAEAEWFDGKWAMWVENPHKGDLDFYKEQVKEKGSESTVVLHYNGKPRANSKFAQFIKAHSKLHRSFDPPKPWKLQEYASDFVRAEFKRRGKTVGTPRLPLAIVKKAGTDLGVLSFEVLKICTAADARGSEAVTADHARGVVSEIISSSMSGVGDALGRRSKKSLLAALGHVHRTSPRDPTMQVCGFLYSKASMWLKVASLRHLPPEEIARELDVNPWLLQKQIYPFALRWGRDDSIKLVRALADSQRAVKDGHINPWIGMCARLLQAC